MGDGLKPFGRYFLMDLLAQGGMAEIYRARMASAEGASRLIVIKKIQAGYGQNPEFLQMFKSEIQVTMGFNHPNIVQLYDFGEEDHQPYIAMEWVDGKNLRQFMTRFAEAKQTFPVELAAYIAEQSAAGLHYAHSYRDKISGSPLNIVHRDISPQNVLISFEGNVKVIDFGIAKATTNSEATRAGIIKGKPSYLSPEQITGEALDGRSDIFALGAVLWELLVGKKLFAGENDLATLKMIESSQTHVQHPSLLNPAVPVELDQIVMRALTKQRDQRYQTADEMQRALHRFIYAHFSDFNPSDLAACAKNLFKNEILEDRKKIQKLSAQVEDKISLVGSDRSSEPFVQTETKSHSHTQPSIDVHFDDPLPKSKLVLESPIQSESTNSRTTRNTLKTQASYTRSRSNVILGNPNANKRSGIPKWLGIPVIVGVGALVYFSDSWMGQTSNPAPASGVVETPLQSAATKASLNAANNAKMIVLKLNISPISSGVSVQLNGQDLPAGTLTVPVALDSPLELIINRPEFKTFQSQFVVDSKQTTGLKEWVMDIALEPLHFGYLTIHTTPSANATLMIDGTPWVKRTPLENEKLPVGRYQVQLSNEVLGMAKSLNIFIQEGKSVKIDESLEIK